jgi:hypothetical protein
MKGEMSQCSNPFQFHLLFFPTYSFTLLTTPVFLPSTYYPYFSIDLDVLTTLILSTFLTVTHLRLTVFSPLCLRNLGKINARTFLSVLHTQTSHSILTPSPSSLYLPCRPPCAPNPPPPPPPPQGQDRSRIVCGAFVRALLGRFCPC